MRAQLAVIGRDVSLAFRSGGGALHSVIFFALAALVFALAIGPDLALLSGLAAPILWAIALLSALVSLDRLFQADFEDGSLDTIVETADFLELSVLAKSVAHWLSAGLPVVLAAPAVALLLNLPAEGYAPLLLSLLVGTPALSFLGAIGAAVALGLRRASILVAILSGPLFAPALIFGVGAARAGAVDSPQFLPAILLLGAITLFGALLGPIAGAAAIRLNMTA
ncbi:MAG: heme exporter protein CcmB [Parvularculaceae bacterium]|nr:heme exporter protein CcmB [Parvularculaceae bacterium]